MEELKVEKKKGSSVKVASFQVVVTAMTVFLLTAKFFPLLLSHHAPAEMFFSIWWGVARAGVRRCYC